MVINTSHARKINHSCMYSDTVRRTRGTATSFEQDHALVGSILRASQSFCPSLVSPPGSHSPVPRAENRPACPLALAAGMPSMHQYRVKDCEGAFHLVSLGKKEAGQRCLDQVSLQSNRTAALRMTRYFVLCQLVRESGQVCAFLAVLAKVYLRVYSDKV